MGKLYDSILSGTSGRTGKIVVANVHGIEYTRIRPRRRSNAPTSKQALINKRMKDTVVFMQSYRSYACAFFGHRVGAKSRYNLAMVNILESMAIDYVADTITMVYPNISFSKGGLLGAIPLTMTKPNATTLEINWQDNSGGSADRENDMLQILIAAEDDLNTYFLENAAPRNAETYTVSLPFNMQGKTLHVYLAFRDANEITASNSQYVGSIS